MNRITVVDLGRMAYRPALELQRALVRARLEGGLVDDLLLLVEHDPVVTLGRGTRSSSLPLAPAQLERRGFDVVEVERGGDVTVHGPGQLVGYPIIDLERFKPDLHWYLRQLEGSLIGALNRLGVSARQNPGLTGVWVADRKIASIGIHVKRWVTLHGFALNVTTDLSLFDAVVPCGIPGVIMTSVANEVEGSRRQSKAVEGGIWERTRDAVIAGFGDGFGVAMVHGNLEDLNGIEMVRESRLGPLTTES
ncbi:MAG TPA: lipoyl(octanoyl) transferase LipB [Gemmatimonadales bacterium]|nr:lipoyl(octanoyl) transferase LipB [Gemmatimonadales bacterium]